MPNTAIKVERKIKREIGDFLYDRYGIERSFGKEQFYTV